MKKKVLLVLITIAFVLSLSVGGTLMLLASKTNEAKNVVTMGNGISARLLENAGMGDSVTFGEDEGYDYLRVQPGQELVKEPYVKRSETQGEVDLASNAYVAVHAVLTVSGDYDGFTSEDAVLELLGKVDIQASSLDWRFVRTDDCSGWFFYINNDMTLKVLEPGHETSKVFDMVIIPNYSDGAELELFTTLAENEISFALELTAYLIQSDNNPYNKLTAPTDISDYQIAFQPLVTIP